ncbi:alpha/beta hydrolase [Mycobacterium sp. MYCO198283]|uniref:alpha/beta fold hydrolase n=1 Tax=Mycobacterium sp. MYCO198283 TaxID=2883505 RepID=UPI001E60CC52|nr:alpha/beta fold hydrolase [Mycobacterium sp. MYCO198283]MCG5431074.1 alpha/beta hydrolase [Mycobacterium sp. MYCO198283]
MPTLSTRAGRLAYSETGSGRPVLLLHAALHDRHDFEPVTEFLAERHRVIALDWPGHGDSEPAPELTGHLLGEALEDVVAALELSGVVVIGNAIGGAAAAHLAIVRPDVVAGLVLVNTDGFARPKVARLLGLRAVSRAVLPGLVARYIRPQSVSDRRIAGTVAARARTGAGSAQWARLLRTTADLRAPAAAITAPTLIVWGSQDALASLKVARAARDAVPRAKLVVLPTGRLPFSSQPRNFLHAVEPFLRRALTG